jgi:hypothetical protein
MGARSRVVAWSEHSDRATLITPIATARTRSTTAGESARDQRQAAQWRDLGRIAPRTQECTSTPDALVMSAAERDWSTVDGASWRRVATRPARAAACSIRATGDGLEAIIHRVFFVFHPTFYLFPLMSYDKIVFIITIISPAWIGHIFCVVRLHVLSAEFRE